MVKVAARKLKDEDLVGKSDPYVELWLDDKKYKQKTTTKKGTLTPTWNEDFKFNITDDRKHSLHLKVLDEDIGDDDKIGETKIDLEEVYKKGYVDQWIKLPALFGLTSHGEIHVVLEFSKH
ncbi:hypothetical protein G9A89_020256 [Geosiphon pyriformis]|nr:hypothetical protein G9A89_020256 [Geosiphon pyriformis]